MKTMKKVPHFLLILALVCGLSACQKRGITQPDGLDPASVLAGEWSGSIGLGSLELMFQSHNKGTSGTVTLDFGEGPVTHSFQAVRWENPTEFRIDLPCLDACERILTGQAVDAFTLEGFYTERSSTSENRNFFRRWTASKNPKQASSFRIN